MGSCTECYGIRAEFAELKGLVKESLTVLLKRFDQQSTDIAFIKESLTILENIVSGSGLPGQAVSDSGLIEHTDLNAEGVAASESGITCENFADSQFDNEVSGLKSEPIDSWGDSDASYGTDTYGATEIPNDMQIMEQERSDSNYHVGNNVRAPLHSIYHRGSLVPKTKKKAVLYSRCPICERAIITRNLSQHMAIQHAGHSKRGHEASIAGTSQNSADIAITNQEILKSTPPRVNAPKHASLAQLRPASGKKTAAVWQHFGFLYDQRDGMLGPYCKLCSPPLLVLQSGTGTTNLLAHISRHHRSVKLDCVRPRMRFSAQEELDAFRVQQSLPVFDTAGLQHRMHLDAD